MFNVVFFGSNGKALASKIDVSSLLVGDGLYYSSNQLASKTFTTEFASLISGIYTFANSNLKTFTGSLTSLQNGESMFSSLGSFTTFTADLPNLSNGTYMFYNTPLLTSFASDLPNLRTGSYMFQNAIALPSFSVPLPKLTNGSRMFDGCASLETFNSVLPSLENGSYMFQGCKLSGRSVRNIVESLPTYETQHSITIGINCTEDIEGQREFLCETGYNTFEEIEDALAAKGWKVVWHFQGFPSGWRPVEYLESTGTQYIDTGLELTNECDVTLDMQMEQTDIVSCAIFGAQEAGNNQGYAASLFQQQAQNYGWFFYKNTSSVILVKDIPTDNRYERLNIDITNGLLSINGEAIIQGNSGSFSTERTCWLFHRNSYTNPAAFTGKIYSFSISRAGTLQLDLVPCIDNIGNPCMYDKVSKTSLYNQTDTKFLVPTTSATYTLRQLVAEFAQLTDSGVRKLYHLPYDYEGTLEEFVEENGFKQLVENEKPEEGNWAPVWEETEDAVILNWVEAPEEIIEI